jgi:hypothetical protein
LEEVPPPILPIYSKVPLKEIHWGYSSVAEHLPSMCQVFGSIPSTAKRKKERKKDLQPL